MNPRLAALLKDYRTRRCTSDCPLCNKGTEGIMECSKISADKALEEIGRRLRHCRQNHVDPPPTPAGDAEAAAENGLLSRVQCYGCDERNLLDGSLRQWCRNCNVPLAPAPAWVKALGWPTVAIPSHEKRRLHHRAAVPVKHVRFDSDDGRCLAGSIEILARRDGVRMNVLLLDLLRAGLEHRLQRTEPGGG